MLRFTILGPEHHDTMQSSRIQALSTDIERIIARSDDIHSALTQEEENKVLSDEAVLKFIHSKTFETQLLQGLQLHREARQLRRAQLNLSDRRRAYLKSLPLDRLRKLYKKIGCVCTCHNKNDIEGELFWKAVTDKKCQETVYAKRPDLMGQ